MVACLVGSLAAVDPSVEAVPLGRNLTSAAEHHNTASVNHLRQEDDQQLHCHEELAVVVARLAEWLTECQWGLRVKYRAASETAAAENQMLALGDETMQRSVQPVVQVGLYLKAHQEVHPATR